jgi:hypothetical protein
MKIISIRQPWASLIVSGLKDVENRTWRTRYRGRVLKLARSVREGRPDLVGHHCSISVTDENGADVCIIPLEIV